MARSLHKTQSVKRRLRSRRFRRRFHRAPLRLAHKKSPSIPVEIPVVKPAPAAAPAPRLSPKRPILLCPGPVNTSPHVHSALAGPDLCHREPEFRDLLQTVRAKLVHVLGLDQRYTAVIMNGSGTAALESAVLASVDPREKLLVVNNGVYGSRIVQMARIHQIPFVEIRSPLTERPDLSRMTAALKRERSIGTIAMVHHETSTGMLNSVEEVGMLAKKFKKRLLVDAVSSLGGEKLDLVRSGVGLCVGSAGKCLHGAPGLSFVLLSQEEASRVGRLQARSLYLNLGLHWMAQEAGDPPFTPAVPLVAAFNAALDDLSREGVKNRVERYRERAVLLREGFKKLRFQFLLEETFLSNSLTSLWLPKDKSYNAIHDPLKKAGFVIYSGQSELKGKILRVAHMGHLLLADLKEFLRVLKQVGGAE